MNVRTRRIVSIDPGLTGAIAWLSQVAGHAPTLIAVHDIPTATTKQNNKNKAQLLMAATAALIATPFAPPDAVVIEQVNAMPGQGVTSMFRFGETFGALQGITAGLGLPLHLIRPQEWQPAVRQPKGDDAGRLRANQIFPEHAHLFARKMDHNRADAALIGYGWALRNPFH